MRCSWNKRQDHAAVGLGPDRVLMGRNLGITRIIGENDAFILVGAHYAGHVLRAVFLPSAVGSFLRAYFRANSSC
jgi:hypothetical protein